MDEYIGCKLKRNWDKRSIRFAQPVMIQSFKGEFDVFEGSWLKTPAEPGSVLVKWEEENGLMNTLQTVYHSGMGKLLHMMRWSHPELLIQRDQKIGAGGALSPRSRPHYLYQRHFPTRFHSSLYYHW
jgi:hypothetical protein